MFKERRLKKAIRNLAQGELAVTRCWAAGDLGRIGDSRGIEPLQFALLDENCGVRLAAAGALQTLGQPKWKQWVTGSNNDFAALGESKDDSAIDLLIKGLAHRDSRIRAVAAKGLGLSASGRGIEPLIQALSCSDQLVSLTAAEALGRIGDPRALQPLAGALKDPRSPMIRSMAAKSLGSLGRPDALCDLLAALKDQAASVRAAATAAIAALGEQQRALPELIRVSYDEDANARAAAALALGGTADPRSVNRLIHALTDAARGVSMAAAISLLRLSDPAAFEPLLRPFSDARSSFKDSLKLIRETRSDDYSRLLSDLLWADLFSCIAAAISAMRTRQWEIASSLSEMLVEAKDILASTFAAEKSELDVVYPPPRWNVMTPRLHAIDGSRRLAEEVLVQLPNGREIDGEPNGVNSRAQALLACCDRIYAKVVQDQRTVFL